MTAPECIHSDDVKLHCGSDPNPDILLSSAGFSASKTRDKLGAELHQYCFRPPLFCGDNAISDCTFTATVFCSQNLVVHLEHSCATSRTSHNIPKLLPYLQRYESCLPHWIHECVILCRSISFPSTLAKTLITSPRYKNNPLLLTPADWPVDHKQHSSKHPNTVPRWDLGMLGQMASNDTSAEGQSNQSSELVSHWNAYHCKQWNWRVGKCREHTAAGMQGLCWWRPHIHPKLSNESLPIPDTLYLRLNWSLFIMQA